MGSTLPAILQPGVINETVSQLNVTNDRLRRFFSTGGSNPIGGRLFAWDVFNETRDIAEARALASGPARINPQPFATVSGQFPRVNESVPLDFEKIHNLRRSGSLEIDKRGENYILLQERELTRRTMSHIEFQYMGMIRGQYFHSRNGESVKVSLTAGEVTIDFRVPAGNKDQLDMLGAGDIIDVDWANAASDIPRHLTLINAAFEVLSGRALQHIWLNSKTMNDVMNNTKMKDQGGSANTVFEMNGRVDDNDFVVRMRATPWISFHVTDGLLTIDGTQTPLFADDQVLFCPTPDPDWIQLYEGSEVVIEETGDTPAEQFGAYFHARTTIAPAGYELISYYNGIPALKVPNNIAFGNVNVP